MSKFAIPTKQPQLEMAANERRYFERNGYWLCLGCKEPCAEVENLGEHNQHCKKCKSMVQWIPPVSPGRVQPGLVANGVGDELSSHGTKASLTEAAFKGFHVCLSCGHIVKVRDGECVQCGSKDVKWNKPVLCQEVVEEAVERAETSNTEHRTSNFELTKKTGEANGSSHA